jgi:disulfide bond formation protein DsbB
LNNNRIYALLSVAVLILTIIPVGTAVFYLGFALGDSPCVMCWEQRTGMVLVALIGLFVLRYGPRPKYIGLSILVGAWGLFMGMRHTGMHAARDVGQGFSIEILGAHTYTWALFIFWICVATMGTLLLLLKETGTPGSARRALGPLEKAAFVVFLAAIAGNVVQAFASTGPPPFMGQSDPVRFSFKPGNWVWSLEEWSPAPVSLRGRWAIGKPSLDGLPADPGKGPLSGLPSATIKERKQLGLPLRGTPTDLSYEESTDRFLITTQQGVYITDSSLRHIIRSTVVDPGYSVDLGNFGGAAFLDGSTVVALGENKSYVQLKENDRADAAKNFRYFLESPDKFDEVSRSRLGTVRARMMYTLSLAYLPSADSLFTFTVPNARFRRMTVSRFDRRDMILSEEFVPTLSPPLRFQGEKRSLDEYYVTGAAAAGGSLYAVSAAYSTILVLSPASRSVTAAFAVPGLERPVGIALKGNDIYLLNSEGTVLIAGIPAQP